MLLTNRKRAVSEIVATLIILVATISIGVTLFAVSSNGISSSILNQQNQSNLYIQRLQERLAVYDVWFTTANNVQTMVMHVYNYGQVDVQIADIYTNISGTQAVLSSYNSAYPNNVVVSPEFQLQLSMSFAFVKGTAYEIVVVSTSGSTFTTVWSV